MTTTDDRPTIEAPDLRPIDYRTTDPHPDASPCPSWCQYVTEGEPAPHDVDVRSGLGDVEHSDLTTFVRASLYRGKESGGQADFATIETHLAAVGSAPPVVEVNLRYYEYPGPQMVYKDLLNLTLEDARELASVLTYLADVALQECEERP